jgi:hypothetical protein
VPLCGLGGSGEETEKKHKNQTIKGENAAGPRLAALGPVESLRRFAPLLGNINPVAWTRQFGQVVIGIH